MESYGGLPAQLVHLQNPFLHPALEARLPFGSTGAFRPVVTSSTSSTPTSTSSADERISVKGLSSAFTAANLVNNRRKLDSIVESVIEQQHHQSGRSRGSGGEAQRGQSQQNEQNAYSQQASASAAGVINLDKSSSASAAGFMNGGQSRHRSSSPTSINVHVPNSSPSVKQEERDRADECAGDDRDGNGTPHSDVTERSTPEDAHPSKSKKQVDSFASHPLFIIVLSWSLTLVHISIPCIHDTC